MAVQNVIMIVFICALPLLPYCNLCCAGLYGVCTVSGCRVRDGGLCDRIILGEDSLRLPAAGRTTRLPEVSIITYNLNCDKLIQFSMDV